MTSVTMETNAPYQQIEKQQYNRDFLINDPLN